MLQVIGILKYLATRCKNTVGENMEIWKTFVCIGWELGNLAQEMVITGGL